MTKEGFLYTVQRWLFYHVIGVSLEDEDRLQSAKLNVSNNFQTNCFTGPPIYSRCGDDSADGRVESVRLHPRHQTRRRRNLPRGLWVCRCINKVEYIWPKREAREGGVY